MSRNLRSRLAFWVFWPALALWTWKLVEPKPLPESLNNLFSGFGLLKFLAAKTLHASAYAFLTVLAGWWLSARRSAFAFALSLLMFHAVLTEIIQTMVPNRSGKVTDVMIDWCGIALGMVFAGSNWRKLRVRSRG